MRLSTALFSTAALLLLLPLAAVQAGGTATGLDRELHNVIEGLENFHLPDDPFTPVGVIGDGRGRRGDPQHGPSGHVGSNGEPVSYGHGSSPFEHGLDLNPGWSTSYHPLPPSSSYEHHPTRPPFSGSARSVYRDARSFARPGSYNDLAFYSAPSSQRTARPSGRDDGIWDSTVPPPAQDWDHRDIERLSAGSKRTPSSDSLRKWPRGSYDPSTSSPSRDARLTANLDNKVDQVSASLHDEVVQVVRNIRWWQKRNGFKTADFVALGLKSLEGQKLDQAGMQQLLEYVKKVESVEEAWPGILKSSGRHGKADIDLETATAMMDGLDQTQRQVLVSSAIEVNLAYRLRAQKARSTQTAQNSGKTWDDKLFRVTFEQLKSLAASARYFIEAEANQPANMGTPSEELIQLSKKVEKFLWPKEHELPQQEGV